MSRKASSPRFGILGVLAVLMALAAGYLNNCFTGLGFAPGTGPGAATPKAEPAAKTERAAAEEAPRARVTVQGERCRSGAEPALRACDEVCAAVEGKTAEIEATAGAQRTVDALKRCLEGRGLKVHVASE